MKNTLRLNHETRTIVMDRTFAKFAANTMSPEYAHLQRVRMDYPTYTVKQRHIKTKPGKESYRGLTYTYMEHYIELRGTKDCGYGLTEIVLDASHCGVPQKRKRFFCIGSIAEEDGFLTDYLMRAQAEKEMTLRDYFGDSLGFEHYYRHPRNYSRRGVFSIDEPAPTMRGVNRPVPKGYPGHHLDTAPITEDIRALTTMERAWIQTFPKNFMFVGNKTDIEQMIGNAVPVKLAEFVAKALMYHIEHKEQSNEK